MKSILASKVKMPELHANIFGVSFVVSILLLFSLVSCRAQQPGQSGITITPEASQTRHPKTATPRPSPTQKPPSVSDSSSKSADVQFLPSSANKTVPADVLEEISYFGGGGGAICAGEFKVPRIVSQPVDIELMYLQYVTSCGWGKNETITVTVKLPDGRIKQDFVTPDEDSGIYYVKVPLKQNIDAPVGQYTITLEGKSGKLTETARIREPSGPRLASIDDEHLLVFGYQPFETVRLLYYYGENFSAWQEYQVDGAGVLQIQIPKLNSKVDFYFAIGEKSGEARLFQENILGTFDWVKQKSIRSVICGQLPSRLTVSTHARVAFTDGADMRIRQKPGLSQNIIERVPEGTRFLVLDGPKCIDDISWWKIDIKDGWVAEYVGNTYLIEPQK
jgi:hypothetical protein